MISPRTALFTALVGATASAANAAYIDTMVQTGADPATYGTLVQTLDAQLAGYNFQVPGGFTNSGYANEILGPGDVPLATVDRTQIRTDVYQVNSAQSFTQGPDTINLVPGDLVFAYRIRLTSNSANTVDTLRTWGVTGTSAGFGGNGVLASPLTQLKGHGYYINALAPNPADFGPIDTVGQDLLYFPPDFGAVDWNWSATGSEQLASSEEITLLLFSSASPIIEGFAKMLSPSGQSLAGTTFEDTGAPVLIPGIPSPGAIALVGLAGGVVVVRRRR